METLKSDNYSFTFWPDQAMNNSFLLKMNFNKSLFEKNSTLNLRLDLGNYTNTLFAKENSLNQSSFEIPLDFTRKKCASEEEWNTGNFVFKL